MWTLKLAPAARSVGPHFSTCGAEPEIEHKPAGSLSIDQVTPEPEPAGNGSLTVTPLARPVPVFETVTLKPMLSPALTVAASAVFRIVTFAGLHVIDADD